MAEDAITVVKTGSIINFTVASASVTIPTDSAGTTPKYCRLASTQPCYVNIGVGSATAVAGDILVQPADAVVVRTHGLTHVAALQVSTGGVLQISPLEGQ